MSLSGIQWVSRFQTSASTDDLADPFRTNVKRFLAALQAAGVTVSIAATLRPPQRAYLMRSAYAVARTTIDPRAVPVMPGVDIQWLHVDAQGNPNLPASRAAAEQMVQAFGIVSPPALTHSRHEDGLAIDMSIAWSGDLTVKNAGDLQVLITSVPRTGAVNPDLWRVGASYGVNKLAMDPPHWSSDGH